MLCAITGIKKLPVVVVATRTTSLSVLQLEVAAGTYRTDKTTRGMAMVSSLDARLVVEIIVAISTDRSVSIEPLFHIGERRHIFLDAQLFANSLLFGVYVSIKFGNDIGSTIQIRFKYFIIDATHAHATESRSLMYGNATIVRSLKRFEIYV